MLHRAVAVDVGEDVVGGHGGVVDQRHVGRGDHAVVIGVARQDVEPPGEGRDPRVADGDRHAIGRRDRLGEA